MALIRALAFEAGGFTPQEFKNVTISDHFEFTFEDNHMTIVRFVPGVRDPRDEVVICSELQEDKFVK